MNTFLRRTIYALLFAAITIIPFIVSNQINIPWLAGGGIKFAPWGFPLLETKKWLLLIGIPLFPKVGLFFPFITGKNFLFRMLVEVAGLLYLALCLRDPAVRPRRTPILAAFLSFVILLGLSDLFGANPFKSFWSNYERM